MCIRDSAGAALARRRELDKREYGEAETRGAQCGADPIDARARATLVADRQSGEERERETDRQHVDEEHPAPREMVDDDATEERPDDHRAGRERRPQADCARANRIAHRRRDERERARHEERARRALQGPSRDEQFDRGRCRDGDRSDAEPDQTDSQNEHSAVGVARGARDEDQSAEGDEIGVDGPLLCGKPAPELARNRGECDVCLLYTSDAADE